MEMLKLGIKMKVKEKFRTYSLNLELFRKTKQKTIYLKTSSLLTSRI